MPKKSRFPIIRNTWPRVIDYRSTRLGSIMVDGRWRGNGRREYFHDVTEAKARADQLAIERQNHGTALLNFPAEDRVMAVESRELLRPWGKTIRDATQHYLAHLQAEASNGSSPLIRDCVMQYLVTRAADAHRGDLAKRSLDEIRSRMTQFAGVFSDVRVMALSADQLKTYLDSFPVSALTRNNIRRVLSGLFTSCISKKWLMNNPAAEIRIKVRRVEVAVIPSGKAESATPRDQGGFAASPSEASLAALIRKTTHDPRRCRGRRGHHHDHCTRSGTSAANPRHPLGHQTDSASN